MSVLTAKQQRFIAEYLVDSNATQAAIRAGYSAKTAHAIGHENLKKPEIARLIAEGQQTATQKAVDKYEVSRDRVIGELARLGFSNMEDFASVNGEGTPGLDFSKLDRDQWAAVQSLKVDDDGGVTLKLYDKRATLIDLGKVVGLFTDKVDVKLELPESTPLELARGLAFVLALAQREAGASTAAPAAPPIQH